MKKVNYTKNRRVLIVDDVEVHRVMMNTLLSKVNPFIMVSSNTESEDIIHAFMTLGVDAYVAKPFKAQDLYDKVVTAFDKRNPD